MKSTELRKLVERVALDRGTPDALSDEIVDLALSQLVLSPYNYPRRARDVAPAVETAWREWSRRLWAALEAQAA